MSSESIRTMTAVKNKLHQAKWLIREIQRYWIPLLIGGWESPGSVLWLVSAVYDTPIPGQTWYWLPADCHQASRATRESETQVSVLSYVNCMNDIHEYDSLDRWLGHLLDADHLYSYFRPLHTTIRHLAIMPSRFTLVSFPSLVGERLPSKYYLSHHYSIIPLFTTITSTILRHVSMYPCIMFPCPIR